MSNLVSKLIPISDADISKVRAIYKKSEADIQVDVDIIIEWLEQQRHLPKENDRKRLERFLLRNKFRLEQTKQKLDAYYCRRLLYGEFFGDLDPRSKRMKTMKSAFYHIPLPKLTPSMDRVAIFKVGKVTEGFSFTDYAAFACLFIEFQLSHDYASSEWFIFDMEGYTMSHFKTINVSNMTNTIRLYLGSYSGRLGGVDIINPMSFMPMMMSLLHVCLPEKIMGKIRVHKTIDTLYERVPRDILPVDYGGNERPMGELHEDIWKMMDEQRDFIIEKESMVSDESLRINGAFRNEMFGVEGSFKKINID